MRVNWEYKTVEFSRGVSELDKLSMNGWRIKDILGYDSAANCYTALMERRKYRTNAINSKEFVEELINRGIVPGESRSVVIELSVDKPALIHVTQYGTRELLEVVSVGDALKELEGATVRVAGEKTQRPPIPPLE